MSPGVDYASEISPRLLGSGQGIRLSAFVHPGDGVPRVGRAILPEKRGSSSRRHIRQPASSLPRLGLAGMGGYYLHQTLAPPATGGLARSPRGDAPLAPGGGPVRERHRCRSRTGRRHSVFARPRAGRGRHRASLVFTLNPGMQVEQVSVDGKEANWTHESGSAGNNTDRRGGSPFDPDRGDGFSRTSRSATWTLRSTRPQAEKPEGRRAIRPARSRPLQEHFRPALCGDDARSALDSVTRVLVSETGIRGITTCSTLRWKSRGQWLIAGPGRAAEAGFNARHRRATDFGRVRTGSARRAAGVEVRSPGPSRQTASSFSFSTSTGTTAISLSLPTRRISSGTGWRRLISDAREPQTALSVRCAEPGGNANQLAALHGRMADGHGASHARCTRHAGERLSDRPVRGSAVEIVRPLMRQDKPLAERKVEMLVIALRERLQRRQSILRRSTELPALPDECPGRRLRCRQLRAQRVGDKVADRQGEFFLGS